MSIEAGCLYVVATPIGNLGDLSHRAAAVLGAVDGIVAEDTRHTRGLLSHYGIARPLTALHEHNEREVAPTLVRRLCEGASLALVSDAGTPLISDPGFRLVRAARAAGVPVSPVPGPSALVAALSVAGLPTDRFRFEGFPPAKGPARRAWLQGLAGETATLVFYESSHRIRESLADMAAAFGGAREAVVARELTKSFETVRGDTLEALAAWVAADPDQRKGELVVLVAGAPQAPAAGGAEGRRVLGLLLPALPLKQAVALAAEITGEKRNALYRVALEMTGGENE